MKIRQDAWSHEDDVLLAETVLKHIKEGSTQLRAFDEVGDELNRTSAACGFRWNAVVRARYINQIEEAKKERKERKRAASYNYYYAAPPANPAWSTPKLSPKFDTETSEEMDIHGVIQYLQSLAQSNQSSSMWQVKAEVLEKENENLRGEVKHLQSELNKLKQDTSIIEEDYQSLIQIMNRARRMAVLEDEESLHNPTFKMDKNGNLERVAK
ncbi:transcriptional regulator [Alkalihalobacillus alcalophilus ATCC 27647 = CGMCC 1.3604]|uniref:Transcriptional regulator n=1 Tax=Alkalihalobacillus alcalophilus ATCC 27647 = CGMCC 1.3604 TaxID=1218173 RepID=A0A094XGW2_ALKAL|nr:RsfA family transcriptional regulator [Alkalihalobacillus alcalophilus]KGA98030.1 transcriptional regulator [Alkalihalobacillus alcalophilus ATCC 27647 = CGMCC 1.3604]MED1561846.1 RsfA family transcriptional regulator [Alkalihalobacillus alcalophilus]THG88701.1 transcriptional regulator [Alkalihalobacillus alcalophilus ATCC 27647 = CGMCC 1.3604]